MKLSLSTNWLNRRIADGAAIAEKALELGFDELELGFNTTTEQIPGFKAMLDRIPVGSVHAFAPLPISAPYGSPELYELASRDKGARATARVWLAKTIRFAAGMGADTVVLHAGRVGFKPLFGALDTPILADALEKAKRDVKAEPFAKLNAKALGLRARNGRRRIDILKREIEELSPLLDETKVTLALENLPYLEGFPNESETETLLAALPGARVKAWFDTGHHRVRESYGWLAKPFDPAKADFSLYAGMHLNDVVDFFDDHSEPGGGKVDFAALVPMMRAVRHVVFEPKDHVSEERLRDGIALIRKLISG